MPTLSRSKLVAEGAKKERGIACMMHAVLCGRLGNTSRRVSSCALGATAAFGRMPVRSHGKNPGGFLPRDGEKTVEATGLSIDR